MVIIRYHYDPQILTVQNVFFSLFVALAVESMFKNILWDTELLFMGKWCGVFLIKKQVLSMSVRCSVLF